MQLCFSVREECALVDKTFSATERYSDDFEGNGWYVPLPMCVFASLTSLFVSLMDVFQHTAQSVFYQ